VKRAVDPANVFGIGNQTIAGGGEIAVVSGRRRDA
jgi:hypothetical protein